MENSVNGICKELGKKRIDWNRMEELAANLGEKINAYDGEDTFLSECYKNYRNTGKVNLQLTKLFLKYGFDVTKNEGHNGASCLHALCWSSYDHYIPEIAELLLSVGADSTIGEDGKKGVLDSISWRLGDWMTGEYESANVFEAYYEMVNRAQNGKEYAGIRAFRDAVGEAVTKVEKMQLLDVDNETRTTYLFHCGKKQLVASDYVDFVINPYVRQEALTVEDVSDEFACLVGAKVRGLRFLNNSLAKLKFDNGKAMLVGANAPSGITKPGGWFRIVSSKQGKLPKIGTAVTSIGLWGKCGRGEEIRSYRESTVVMNTDGNFYGLYSHRQEYGRASVRVEEMEQGLALSLPRQVDVHNLVLKHIEYRGEAIQWICFTCDEGFLYVTTDEFNEIKLFLSEK